LAAESITVDGPSTVIGARRRLPVAAAARVNGYMGDIFETNDLIGGHASIGVVSAALALAEEVRSTGLELLQSVICGIEITARLYNCFYPQLKGYEECGMVSVGVPSAVGAAAAASRLRRFSRAETREALAIAAALAGWCPAEVIFGEGGTVKPMLFGAWPAATGLIAAGYAFAGLSGPQRIMESGIGYFATIARGHDRSAIQPAIWALEQPRRKLHACCGYVHSALDAMIALRHEAPDLLRDAVEIEVELPPYILPAVVKTRDPVSPNDARFHLGFCMAIAACGSDTIAPHHSEHFAAQMSRPEIVNTIRLIGVISSRRFSHYHQARVRVVAPDGTAREAIVTAPKGSPLNPMSTAEVISKFDALTGPVCGIATLIRDNILELETTQDLLPLFEHLRSYTPRK
jgi:2-methylcitrate dehydratase PrpD